MPLGPGWSTFTPGDPFSPDSIADRFGELENWVNGSINEEDLKTDPWVDSRHVFKPEFYGSPAPRVEAVSGDTHYRYRPHNIESRYYRHEQGGWYREDKIGAPPNLGLYDDAIPQADGLFTPVEGLSGSIHLDSRSLVTVNANWFSMESGGDTGYSKREDKNVALDDRCAMFMLQYQSPDSGNTDRKSVFSTRRVLYATSDTGYKFRRQNFSLTWMQELNPGTHHIWVGVMYLLKNISGNGYFALEDDDGTKEGHRVKHIYVDPRNFVLSAARIYRDRTE
tara:strand:+ start:3261 stop:4100 length:840 start_codon:yes stop_codon:yes gene_type:complete